MGPSPENVEGSRPALLLLHGGCDLQIWSTHEIPVSWERIPQGLGSGSAWGKPEPRIHVPAPPRHYGVAGCCWHPGSTRTEAPMGALVGIISDRREKRQGLAH